MNIFGSSSRNKYEPLDPIPRRGQKKMLNYFLAGIGILTVGILAVVLFFNFSASTDSAAIAPIPSPLVPDDESNFTTIISSTEIPIDNSTIISLSQAETNPRVLKAVGAPAPAEEASTPREDVLVTLDAGELRGKYIKSRAGRDYLAFTGIPYAKPPLGELRFQPPVLPDAWNGTLNATEFKPDCIQKDKYNPLMVTKGSEDCLYLNVFTPKNLTDLGRRRNRFPVMFYVHGGGQFGSGTRYGPDYIMDENVLLVTVHYRLGILGNLNTNDSEARGNQGMKDQVMALQWIQDNIKNFGGDPKKVTIFGNSYGSMQINAHILSPMSKDLFHRAIMQSGTMLQVDLFPRNTRDIAVDLGEKLNCSSSNRINNGSSTEVEDLSSKDLVACFKEIDAVTLILQSFLMEFQISVEPPSNSTDDVFLPAEPLVILQNGEFNNVALMAGTVSGEGLFTALPILAYDNVTKYFNEHWENASFEALNLELAKDPIKIVNAAREFYLGNETLSRALQPNFTDLFSDRNFVHPMHTIAGFQLSKNRRRQHVYLYYFNKDADKTYAQPALDAYGNDNSTFLGAGHADELQFLFPYYDYPYIPEGSKNANFSKMLVRLWTSFAESGKPSGADNGEEWLAIEDPKPYQWFLIDDEPKMIDWIGPRMEFWDQFNLTDLYGLKP